MGGFQQGRGTEAFPLLEGARALLPVLLLRLLVIGAGYGVAVFVATFVTVAHLALPTVLPDEGRFGSFYGFMRDWPMLFAGGFALTATAALPGFMAVVLLAWWRNWHDALRFSAAGAANALLSLWLQGGLAGELLFAALGGGLAGGFGYWLVAERWRDRSLSAPAP